MDFEWDEAKSEWNREHRGFGFEVVYAFDWEASKTRISSRGDELRFYTIGMHEGVPFTIIWTPRSSGTRIISVRRAHRKEAKKYGYDQT